MSQIQESSVITMEDGSTVDFGKRSLIKRDYKIEGEGADRRAVVVFNLRNGRQFTKTISSGDPLLFELAAHGASAKVGDAAAGCNVEDATLSIEGSLKALAEGKWTIRKPSEAKGLTDFLEALCAVKGAETPEEKATLIEKFKNAPEESQAIMKNSAAIKGEILKIRAARAAAKAEAGVKTDEQADEALAAL